MYAFMDGSIKSWMRQNVWLHRLREKLDRLTKTTYKRHARRVLGRHHEDILRSKANLITLLHSVIDTMAWRICWETL